MEQTADGLEALGTLTSETDQANPDPGQVAEQQQQAQLVTEEEQGAREWGAMMFTIGGMFCMVAPELQQIYAEKNCLAWGKHAQAVSTKYGWKSSAMPELALIGSSLSFAVPTTLILREKIREMKEGNAKGLMAKVGAWWKARKAEQAAAAAEASGGGKQ